MTLRRHFCGCRVCRCRSEAGRRTRWRRRRDGGCRTRCTAARVSSTACSRRSAPCSTSSPRRGRSSPCTRAPPWRRRWGRSRCRRLFSFLLLLSLLLLLLACAGAEPAPAGGGGGDGLVGGGGGWRWKTTASWLRLGLGGYRCSGLALGMTRINPLQLAGSFGIDSSLLVQ